MIVLKPGTRVDMGDIPAIVTAVLITPQERVEYKLAWWSGRERKHEWVEACELPELLPFTDVLPIGFK